MIRIAILGVALALGHAAAGQDLTKKISVEIPASKAKTAFAALSKAAGFELEPAANLRDEIFVISVHDVTVDDVMKRIAEAESGAWTHQEGLYILSRDHSKSVTQERQEIAARAKQIAGAIAKLGSSSAKDVKFDQASAQKLAGEAKQTIEQATSQEGPARGPLNFSDRDRTPVARAVAKLLDGIGAAKLAEIGPNQRVVFSTRPTAVQYGLGGDASNIFSSFVEEQQTYAQAYNAGQPQDGTTRTFFVNGLSNPTLGKGDLRLGLGLGLMVVERRFGAGLSIQILAADTRFETLTSGSYMLQLPRQDLSSAETAGGSPLRISDDAREMAKAAFGGNESDQGQRAATFVSVSSLPGATRSGGSNGDFSFTLVGNDTASVKISAELKAKVLNPEKFDPMSFVPGEAMMALGKDSGKNVVALLPDYCFGTLTRQFATDVTASQLLASLAPLHSLAAKQDDSWIVVSPALPATGRSETVNRSALGTLVRALDKNGQFSLDDLGNFATAQDKVPGLNDFDAIYPKLINASVTNRDFVPLATGSYSLYRFYGTLTGAQRAAVAGGRQISFSNLSPEQIGLISDMLYNSAQGPNVQSGQQVGPPRPVNTFTFQSGSSVPILMGGPISALTERTIVVPDGVTGQGFLGGSSQTQKVAQALNSTTGSSSFYDVNGLAFVRSNASQPIIPGFSTPGYDKFRMASQTNLSLHFTFNPRVAMSRSLHDISMDPDSEAGPYDSLPGDFRQQVQAAANQLQQGVQRVGGFGPPSRTPPP